LKNPDGITVYFGSSDVKALLTYFLAEYAESDTYFLADRCKYDIETDHSQENSSACRDTNAGTLHTVMTNQLANMHTSYVIDVDRSIEVWNQPLYKFSSLLSGTRSPSSGSAPGTVVEQQIKTTLYYTKETYPTWKSHDAYIISDTYSYWVELDVNGKILGGSWNTWKRPDFQWTSDIPDFGGYFNQLKTIYQASTGETNRIPRVPKPVMRKLVNHQVLNTSSGVFGVFDYPSDHRASWSIVAEKGSKIKINFDKFVTERQADKLKIYEGEKGEGALLAVLHGNKLPKELIVNSHAAYIVFTSDRQSKVKEGFIAKYRIIQ
jgi:hypothetical protein